ncbi:MAG: putative 7-carboxy-7-deazaguanine synthase QueE [Lachnospiraceae bacterium]|jgi:7-carboxy-7-deazaguanine synthase
MKDTDKCFEVAEKFVSINGEGPLAGEPAVFIRFKGCNLACAYCDTKWASQPDTPAESMSAQDILQYIRTTGIVNVTLTGGEPLLQPAAEDLLNLLGSQDDLHVEIETNGSIPLDPFMMLTNRPSFTMDYKLSCSGMENKMCTANFALLSMKDTVKFVVGSEDDLHRALQIMRRYDLIGRCAIYLSPVFGQIEPKQIVVFMLENRLNGVHVQLQMHKFIWAPDQRGV